MFGVLKALHIISVVCWFAGLFYIFRLFVYHRQKSEDGSVAALLHVMERRLLKAIILPASITTLLSGLSLISQHPYVLFQPWFWGKMFLILLLLCYQALAWRTCSRFRDGRFDLSERACRIINEVPTIVLIGAVLLVVLRP